MSEKHHAKQQVHFDLIAGDLSLDFINTLDDRPTQPKDLLNEYGDLLAFAKQAGVVAREQVSTLRANASMKPKEAAKALQRGRNLREALNDVFSAMMNRRLAPQSSMDTLNAILLDAAEHCQLVCEGQHCEWRFDGPASSLNSVLWPIASSAAELLASGQLPMVRTCSSLSCQWFFLDTSKNHRRRWCDMTKCGNRSKVRDFYARKKGRHGDTARRNTKAGC